VISETMARATSVGNSRDWTKDLESYRLSVDSSWIQVSTRPDRSVMVMMALATVSVDSAVVGDLISTFSMSLTAMPRARSSCWKLHQFSGRKPYVMVYSALTVQLVGWGPALRRLDGVARMRPIAGRVNGEALLVIRASRKPRSVYRTMSAIEEASRTPMTMLKTLSRRGSWSACCTAAPNTSQRKQLGSAARRKRPPRQAA
jgi:hypothetical protein